MVKTKKLNLKEFVNNISKSNSLYLVEKGVAEKVKICQSHYGGCRIDRICDRNKITNRLGFRKCKGRYFMNCEDKNGSGTFLANVLQNYGKNCYFIGRGIPLSFETNIKINGRGYMDFDNKLHFNQVKKPRVREKRVDKRKKRSNSVG